MTRRNRIKAKGRRESGFFIALPMNVIEHPNYINLSMAAHKILNGLFIQIRFKQGNIINNGDLCATWSIMKNRGIGSQETASKGIKELIYYGFIILTRQGEALRSDKPNLYGITWWAIDECDGKLDVKHSQVALGSWKEVKDKYNPKKHGK